MLWDFAIYLLENIRIFLITNIHYTFPNIYLTLFLVQPPPDPNEPTKKRVLRGISFLSLDFGRLSAENLELRTALKQAQLECRQLHERCGRKIQYTNIPITLDGSVQTDLDSGSGATTPSIPSDPLTISEDLHLLAMRRELQLLNEENVSFSGHFNFTIRIFTLFKYIILLFRVP